MNKIKILGVVLLILATIATFTYLNADTVTLTGKGQPHTWTDSDGSIHWKCEPETQNSCSITIQLPKD